MTPLVEAVNQILSLATIAGQILIAAFLFFLAFNRSGNSALLRLMSRHALRCAFVVALIATTGSLFFSEIAGFAPCKLCWFQRIFMYPQVVLFSVALLKKDAHIFLYTTVLSLIGFFIAAYHYLLQLGVAPNVPCSAVGFSVSCSQRFVMNFGYITIPLMAATAFLLVFLLGVVSRRVERNSSA